MNEFIRVQYKLFLSGKESIGLEKIKSLAKIFLTEEEQEELFNTK